MRRSTARRAIVFTAAVSLSLGPAGTVASAQPSDPAPPVPALPADLVAAVERDLNLTGDEYLRRADLAQRLAASTATFRDRYRDSFAGAWLDDSGRGIIALAPSPVFDAARTATTDAGFEVKEVARSESALGELRAQFDSWLTSQPADVAQLVRGVAIDTVANTIAIRVAGVAGLPLPEFLRAVRVVAMPSVASGEPIPVTTVAGNYDRGQLGGGDSFAAANDNGSLRCSLGFNGVDGDGRTVNVSAGHCDPDLASAGSANASEVYELRPFDVVGDTLGQFQKTSLDNHDYSIIRIDDSAKARFDNNLVRITGQRPLSVTGTALPVVGAPACKSGARTGFSCGVVESVDQAVSVGTRPLNGSFSVSICALPGDSGGPIVSGTRALGISSASTVADYPICEIPNLIGPLLGNAPTLFATPIDTILTENPGVQLRTS